jgi:hypothetical protein
MKTNDKVVCIDDVMTHEDARCFSERLVKGRIYAVRSVSDEQFEDGHRSVSVVGITGEVVNGGEVGFCSSRFQVLRSVSANVLEKKRQDFL